VCVVAGIEGESKGDIWSSRGVVSSSVCDVIVTVLSWVGIQCGLRFDCPVIALWWVQCLQRETLKKIFFLNLYFELSNFKFPFSYSYGHVPNCSCQNLWSKNNKKQEQHQTKKNYTTT